MVMIDSKNVFDQPINSDFKTYENVRNIATGQGDDYTTGCLLDYPYFKESYKIIAMDLSKQQALDTDTRPIQQINFTTNVFHYWRGKWNCLRLFTRNCKKFVNMLYNSLSSIDIKWLNTIG